MSQVKGFLGGFALGAMAGAATMLLFAPRSGKRTRARLQHQYEDLREQMTEGMEETEEEVLHQAHRVVADMREKVQELQSRGAGDD
jgi:gas vesicle protein